MENAEERKKMKKIEKEEQLKKKLEQTFQATAGRVYRARCSIEKSIKRELEKKFKRSV